MSLVAIVVLLALLAVFGGLGFAVHFLWWILIALVVLWLIGFFVGHAGPPAAGSPRRRWYRW